MEDDERLEWCWTEYVCEDKAVGGVVERLWQRQFYQGGQVGPSIRCVITHDDLALTIDKYVRRNCFSVIHDSAAWGCEMP